VIVARARDTQRQRSIGLVLLSLAWPVVALAHGGGCGGLSSIEEDAYVGCGVLAALALIGTLGYGLFAIKGRWWWRAIANLLQLSLAAALCFVGFLVNLGFAMSCGGDEWTVYKIMAANFLPALILCATLLLYRMVGRLTA
jgi:hypothetical protein